MKIMSVCRVYPTHRPGGMPFVTQDRAEALAKAGHEVHVVTTNHSERQSRFEQGVMVHYTLSPTQTWSAEFAAVCTSFARQLCPDLIHLDSFDRKNLWWHGMKNVAITMHGFGMGAWLTRCNLADAAGRPRPEFPVLEIQEEVNALSKAKVVIGISKHEHRMLAEDYCLSRAKLVHNPIAPYFFDRPQTCAVPSYFISAAISGQKERGFSQAQKACRRAGKRFLPACHAQRRDMPARYDGAIALLLPTAYSQGFDLGVAEARARGVPAIMSNVGSYAAEREDFDLLVRPLHVMDMVEAIKTMAATPPDREVVRLAAERHRPERHIEAWLEAVAG